MTHELEHDENDPRLKALLDAAAALPREADPPAGGWQAVASRITPRRSLPVRRVSRAWWGLAAAAVIVLGVMLPLRPKQANTPLMPISPPLIQQVAPVDQPAAPVALEVANPDLARTVDRYKESARELEAAIATRSMSLPPATREAVKKSLADIDAAIADLVAALGTAPHDSTLSGAITAVYEQKLDLLRRVRTASGASM